MAVTGSFVGGWVDLFITVTLYDGKKEEHRIRERATAAKHEEQRDSGDYGHYLIDHVYYTDVEIDWFNVDEMVEAYLYHKFGDLGYLPVYELLYIDDTSFVED